MPRVSMPPGLCRSKGPTQTYSRSMRPRLFAIVFGGWNFRSVYSSVHGWCPRLLKSHRGYVLVLSLHPQMQVEFWFHCFSDQHHGANAIYAFNPCDHPHLGRRTGLPTPQQHKGRQGHWDCIPSIWASEVQMSPESLDRRPSLSILRHVLKMSPPTLASQMG